MSISVTLPLDYGFLRRECPDCERQFKWHHGPTDVRPADAVDPPVYFCPYCGASAPVGHWWTTEQAEHLGQLGTEEIGRALSDAFRDLGRRNRNSLIKFKVKPSAGSEPPDLMHEPHDMVVVEPPCHAWEPIKIADEWAGTLYCLVCGEQFAA